MRERNKILIDYYSPGHPLTGLRSRYALKARKRMFDLFMDTLQPAPSSLVLDLGVTPDQSLPESNFFERLYPYKDRIVAASIEDAGHLENIYPGLRFVRIQPGRLPFEDDHFDVLFCSAVIEHVGSRDGQRYFISECLRVARKFFITTPNRHFPVDFHTFIPFMHWLPQPVHQAGLRLLGLDFWAKTENLNLLSSKDLLALFPGCRSLNLRTHKLFGIPSNLIVYGSK